MASISPWWLLVLCCLLPYNGHSLIGPDGLIDLYIFVPFTARGNAAETIEGDGDGVNNGINPGFSHMAAAIMAAEHFNARDPVVVPELADFADCDNVFFNLLDSKVFDTNSSTHTASRLLMEQERMPDAIAGPFHDLPALDLSVMAQSALFPLVTHGGTNLRLTNPTWSPYTSSVFPDIIGEVDMVVEWLFQQNRTDFFSLLYAASDMGTQIREVLAMLLSRRNVAWNSQAFQTDGAEWEDRRSFLGAMGAVKRMGYRTILVAMTLPLSEMDALADAAEELGMNNGDYVWAWLGNFEPLLIYSDNSNVTKLLAGSAWMVPIDNFFLANDDAFETEWKHSSQPFVDLVNTMNPIPPGRTGYVNATVQKFQQHAPEWGSGFMYDAVTAIGMGACLARDKILGSSNSNNVTIPGWAHLQGIRNVSFSGASGLVDFGNGDLRPGARRRATPTWGTLNVLPPDPNLNRTDDYQITHISFTGQDNWTKIGDFYFANGKSTAPELLRDTPKQNYLSDSLKITGLTLMGIAVLSSMIAAAWVFINRGHRVLLAAQPTFLYVICVGAAVASLAILPRSFDESDGLNQSQLDAFCMATPWLMIMGFSITYSALFCKLWRINKVLQFSRRKIKVKHVAGPALAIFILVVLILGLWTGLDPLRWTRKEINAVTGESIGECGGMEGSADAYFVPLIFLVIVPATMTAVMAWKTKDVDDAYSESRWIFTLIMVQIEFILVGAPVISILRNVSTDGKYVGWLCILWLFPMSTLLLIMLPKVMALRRARLGVTVASKRGDASGNVRVSGLSEGENDASRLSQVSSPLKVSLDSKQEKTVSEDLKPSSIEMNGDTAATTNGQTEE